MLLIVCGRIVFFSASRLSLFLLGKISEEFSVYHRLMPLLPYIYICIPKRFLAVLLLYLFSEEKEKTDVDPLLFSSRYESEKSLFDLRQNRRGQKGEKPMV